MRKEYGRDLEEHIMNEYWHTVQNKSYPKFKGVWEQRNILPITSSANFEEETETPRLEIPLMGGGHIRLGRTDEQNPEISVRIKHPTARGDGEMKEDGFVVMRDDRPGENYPFEIFYDSEEQDERMKYLSRMDPVRDIDWERIKPETDEYEIAKAFCKYREFEAKPKTYYYTKR